jgi:oligopeptide/dipeptide ABC transporter ATP-binding protein
MARRSRPPSESAILEVRDLRVHFGDKEHGVQAVDGVSFDLYPGRTCGIVGESGSGKSATALALMALHDERTTDVKGSVRLQGRELVARPEQELLEVRGRRIAMIFQDPMTSLNPFLKIGRQLTEVLEVHEGLSRRAAKRRSIEVLERVGIPDAARRIEHYPHQFSGGMRQRVMIAMALLCRPDVLIADEPTTALDVTIQAQILSLLDELCHDLGASVVFITHDLGVIAGLADDLLVMYAGRVIEQGPTEAIFDHPQHPYTQGLLRSVPRIDSDAPLQAIGGKPPTGERRPSGCPFHPRCERARPGCSEQQPSLLPMGDKHLAACPYAELAPRLENPFG